MEYTTAKLNIDKKYIADIYPNLATSSTEDVLTDKFQELEKSIADIKRQINNSKTIVSLKDIYPYQTIILRPGTNGDTTIDEFISFAKRIKDLYPLNPIIVLVNGMEIEVK